MIKRKAKRIRKPQVVVPEQGSTQKGFGHEMPPEQALVHIYFDQKEMAGEAELFYQFYQQANWRSPKGTPFRNWKVLASNWIFNHQQNKKINTVSNQRYKYITL